MQKEEAILLYAKLKGYKRNVGNIIEKSILNYYRNNYRGLIPHPATITRLYILGGVKGTWEEKERCFRTSSLTLTGITKPPVDRGKKKLKEIEEEERDGRENEKANVVSSMKKRENKKRSLSPIWNPSPNVKECHQGRTESSGQQSNNIEVLDILKRMEQGMRERDKQLKLQLQLRDEYLDAKLRKKDQYLEEVIRQRDLEWKMEIEERDAMWREELRVRDAVSRKS